MQQIGLDAVLNNVPDFTGGIDKMNKAVDGFAKNGKDAGDSFGNGFGEIVTGALRHVGTLAVDALLKAGQAVTGFVKDSIGLAGDFEAGMNEFAVAAGSSLDTKGLEEFHDLFLQIGKDLPVSTSDVQQAAIELVKGGIDPATVAAGGLKQAIQFAGAAMKGDLAGAAEVSAKIVAGWADVNATAADKADLLTHATDLFTKAANASSTDVAQLSRGIFNAQGIAKTAGVSLDDLTTTIAELSGDFSSSAEAGTSLKNMIARLQPTTDPAISAMEGLGLYTEETGSKFYDAQGNFVGFQQASELLQQSLVGMTKEQQAAALQIIFGNDAMAAAAGLAARGGEGYAAMAESLNKAFGVQEAGATIQAGWNTALDNAKGSVEALQIQLGEHLLPILTKLFDDYITPGINTVAEFANTFAKMAPAIASSDDPIQTFLNALKIAAPQFLDIIGKVEDFKDAITPAVEEIMRLADAFSKGGIGELISTLASDIEAALPDIQAQLGEWGSAFVDWIAPMIPPMLDAFGDLASDAWAWVKEQAPAWGQQLLTWGNELVDWIAPMIPPALAELGKLGDQFLGWVGEQAAPLLDSFSDWAGSFVEWIPGATVTFLAEWPKMFDDFLTWIGDQAGPLLKQFGDWAIALVQWIAPAIPPFLLALGGVALALGTFIVETAAVLSKKLVEQWVPAMLGWIVTDAIPGLGKALNSFLGVFDEWIKDAQASLARAMIDVGKSIVQGIQKGISDAWGSLSSWLTKKIQGLFDIGQAAQEGGSPAMIWTPVGQSIVQGIMLGLTDTWPALTDKIGSLAKGLIDEMEDIGDQIQGAIADSFGATASIDRQIAKNMDKFKDIPETYRQYTEGALKDAEAQARAFADPSQGAEFFQMRSKQILEFADLQKKLADTQNAEDRERIKAQMNLINAAQTAEINQFNAVDRRNPMGDIAAQIDAIMRTLADPKIKKSDEAIHWIDQLAVALGQLQFTDARADAYAHPAMAPSPPSMSAPASSSGPVTNNTYGPTLTMPIYTNNSPAAMQQSMAIAAAAMMF